MTTMNSHLSKYRSEQWKRRLFNVSVEYRELGDSHCANGQTNWTWSPRARLQHPGTEPTSHRHRFGTCRPDRFPIISTLWGNAIKGPIHAVVTRPGNSSVFGALFCVPDSHTFWRNAVSRGNSGQLANIAIESGREMGVTAAALPYSSRISFRVAVVAQPKGVSQS
jgi:hypothetical protein